MLKSKIDKPFEKHDCFRICQGDILRDVAFRLVDDIDNSVKEFKFPYLVVITQDCDLENSKYDLVPPQLPFSNNQFLPNVMFLPAFPAESVREGKHLENLFQVTQNRIDKDLWKPIIKNHNERYHFLNNYIDYQIPELIIDFKTYFTLPTKYFKQIYKINYLATINELFREELSQRFSMYLARIATPKYP